MAWQDERPGVQPRRPLQPALAPRGRDRERLARPVSGRCRELFASGVWRRPHPQDLESADSTTVVRYAVFALLLPSDFLPPQPRRNSERVVIPFRLRCLSGIASIVTKYASKALLQALFFNLTK